MSEAYFVAASVSGYKFKSTPLTICIILLRDSTAVYDNYHRLIINRGKIESKLINRLTEKQQNLLSTIFENFLLKLLLFLRVHIFGLFLSEIMT